MNANWRYETKSGLHGGYGSWDCPSCGARARIFVPSHVDLYGVAQSHNLLHITGYRPCQLVNRSFSTSFATGEWLCPSCSADPDEEGRLAAARIAKAFKS